MDKEKIETWFKMLIKEAQKNSYKNLCERYGLTIREAEEIESYVYSKVF